VGNLPHGGFASGNRAPFVLTSSGPGSAHAPCSGRMWEAAVWGATGPVVITSATWLAPADFRGFPPQGESRQSHESHSGSHSKRQFGLLSHITDATPFAVGLHCVQLATTPSARYLLHVQCVNLQALLMWGRYSSPSI
jgi:hypothetical protein